MDEKKRRYRIVHAIAFCSDCSWNEQDYKTAVKKGRDHAKKTGHTVTVEVGSREYSPPNQRLEGASKVVPKDCIPSLNIFRAALWSRSSSRPQEEQR